MPTTLTRANEPSFCECGNVKNGTRPNKSRLLSVVVILRLGSTRSARNEGVPNVNLHPKQHQHFHFVREAKEEKTLPPKQSRHIRTNKRIIRRRRLHIPLRIKQSRNLRPKENITIIHNLFILQRRSQPNVRDVQVL